MGEVNFNNVPDLIQYIWNCIIAIYNQNSIQKLFMKYFTLYDVKI